MSAPFGVAPALGDESLNQDLNECSRWSGMVLTMPGTVLTMNRNAAHDGAGMGAHDEPE
ncbi:MAG: hypothetical protein ACR2HX_12425 [Pyrinomonadaceae bacterium]